MAEHSALSSIVKILCIGYLAVVAFAVFFSDRVIFQPAKASSFSHGRKLFEAAAGPKQSLVVDGAGHNNVARSQVRSTTRRSSVSGSF